MAPSSSSIISHLQRASLGLAGISASGSGSGSGTLSDADVAALIASEAKEKERIWKEYGLGAYSDRSDSASLTAPKTRTNKRFLSSMIRSVDDHNQALLRQQASLARGSLDQTGSSGRPGSRKRSRSRSRSPPRGMRGWDDITEHAEKEGRTDSRVREGKGKERDRDRYSRREQERDRDRERDSRRDKERDGEQRKVSSLKETKERPKQRKESRTYDSDSDDNRKYSRDGRDRETSSSRHRSHRRDRSPTIETKEPTAHQTPGTDRYQSFVRSPAPPPSSTGKAPYTQTPSSLSRESSLPSSRTYSHGQGRDAGSPLPIKSLVGESNTSSPPPPSSSFQESTKPSKMDKYFEEDYDPRLDVAPVPKHGLVGEGWERMLDLLKEKEEAKRRAKKEKKRQEKADRKAARKSRKNVLGSSSSSDSDSSMERRRRKRRKEKKEVSKPEWLKDMENREKGVMEMHYTKRGEARAWDKDKVEL